MACFIDFETFVKVHKHQLLSSNIPQYLWKSLHKKLLLQIFDAGEDFSLLKIEYENEEKNEYDPVLSLQLKLEEGLKAYDENAIYLIDHAWTYRLDTAKQQLRENEKLLQRMIFITGVKSDGEKEEIVDNVFNSLWKYCCTYSIGNAETAEERLPVWYIMDEVGSSIQHSDDPNVRIVPFLYVPEQITFTLMFPIRNINFAEHITRDYVQGISNENDRMALLLPWKEASFKNCDFKQTEPNEEYFLSARIQESLPVLENIYNKKKSKTTLKVYSEYSLVKKFLTDSRFEIIEDESNADILWLTRHFKSYEELSNTPEKYVNQFPYENILTVKDLFSVVCRRIPENKWMPITYNLKTELIKFVSYYKYRENNNLDNYWICKPWNLARSLDTHITNKLNYILRLPETGPKIAQKYIEHPVLFYRKEIESKVKFDIRYVVLLKSVKPLKVYIYKNFFLRFANKPFELKDFDVYEKHFTVMNYSETAVLKHLPCSEFLKEWENQYLSIKWNIIEDKIFVMLKELFEAATSKPAPCGISESPQSRAVYATDIMLEWNQEETEIQPKLLEMNWTPDCKRACDYYNNFYNDIFALLFFDEMNEIFKEL